MSTFIQWLGMGGYASYVWPAYGLVCSVLAVNVVVARKKRKHTYKQLQKWFGRQQAQ